MTGVDLSDRLLENIQTSLSLRARIPYLDMLKDLLMGGASISGETLNSSSNFGSFDSALREVLTVLHNSNHIFIPPSEISPLPLTAIYDNLSAHFPLLNTVIQEFIDGQQSGSLLHQLELINLSAV